MRLESNSSGGILKGADGGVTTTLVRTYGDSYFNGGNVGIGTTSPQQKLHVAGNGRFESGATGLGGYVTVGNPQETAGNYSAYFFGNTIHDNIYMKGAIAYETLSTTNGRGDMHFLQNSAANGTNASISDSVMTILNDGNVGIGTTSPSYTLDVSGSAGSTARFKGSGGQATVSINDGTNDNYIVAVSGDFQLRPSGTTVLTTKSNGNVGIGTTSPSQKLEVAGAIPKIYVNSSNNTGGSIIFDDNLSTGTEIQGTQGNVIFKQSGSEKMRITSGGNVGIGTTSPAFKTTIYSDSNTDSFPLVVGQPNNANEFVGIGLSGFVASNGAVKAGFVLDRKSTYGVGDIHILNNTTTDNSNATLADSKFTILQNGNVGIGTTSPARKLEVYNGSSSMISQFRSGSGTSSFICFANTGSTADQVRIGSISSNLVLSTNYTERIRIDSSGNVGIGMVAVNSLVY
jgi:hypothetical protein